MLALTLVFSHPSRQRLILYVSSLVLPPAPALTRVPTPMPTAAPTPVPTPEPTWEPPVLAPTPRDHNTELVYYSSTLNWHEARAACLQDGGDLVIIRTEAENRAVAEFVRQRNQDETRIWLGLGDLHVDVRCFVVPSVVSHYRYCSILHCELSAFFTVVWPLVSRLGNCDSWALCAIMCRGLENCESWARCAVMLLYQRVTCKCLTF